jgi:hypothetical protein
MSEKLRKKPLLQGKQLFVAEIGSFAKFLTAQKLASRLMTYKTAGQRLVAFALSSIRLKNLRKTTNLCQEKRFSLSTMVLSRTKESKLEAVNYV